MSSKPCKLISSRFFIVVFLFIFAFTSVSAKADEANASVTDDKVIGILTSGGDCPGLNSIIYAVYQGTKRKGFKVLGFRHGAQGMIDDEFIELNDDNCSPEILARGGSMLRCWTKPVVKGEKKLSKDESDFEMIRTYKKHNLKCLIYIGGDGSTRIMKSIITKDPTLRIVAVPKTIDNDIRNTDVSVGFSTAVQTVSQAVEILRPTVRTHERIMVVEVMGRAAGYIALSAGLVTGADVILVPEIPYRMEEIYQKMHQIFGPSGKKYAFIVVSEAVKFGSEEYNVNRVSDTLARVAYGGIAQKIADDLKAQGFDAKSICLGHLQRGNSPTLSDIELGMRFGQAAAAIACNSNEAGNCQLGIRGKAVVQTKLEDIRETKRQLTPNDSLIKLATELGTYVGDIVAL